MYDARGERKMIVTINQTNEHVDSKTRNENGAERIQCERTGGGPGYSARGQIRCGFVTGYIYKVRKITRLNVEGMRRYHIGVECFTT